MQTNLIFNVNEKKKIQLYTLALVININYYKRKSEQSHIQLYRPLSRRLDRCDRVIQKESGDPNGGNMCSFSGATGTSRVRHNARYVPYAQIGFDL